MRLLKKFTIIIVILHSFVSLNTYAITFNMAPLEFSNRAGCADLSKKPARSVFLQIDAFNAGKAGFAEGLIAKKFNPNEDPAKWAQTGVSDFRIWSTHLAVDIMNALKSGKLPLLSPEGTSPTVYANTVNKCLSRNQFLSCQSMNNLLSELWSRSKMKMPNWSELGLNDSHFFPTSIKENTAIGCHIVRKYSAFHSPLKTQEIDNGTITNIAIDAFNPEKSLDSCFSITEGKDPRFTTVQLDIANIANESEWNKIGFQFWHSFKLYYSWAWRYAPEYYQEYKQFKQAFSSIALEDSVMILPNGCRSVETPKCDSNGLSSDVLRAAKFLGANHPAMSELPVKPIDAILSGTAGSVNNDNLDLYKAENASAWSRDFKDKLSGLRFELQRKLNTGMSKLQIITSLVSANDLALDFTTILNDKNYDKTETYLACMEFTLAKNSLFDDINAEILTLNNTEELKSVLLADSSKNLANYIEYYKLITSSMGAFCKSLEESGNAKAQTNDPDLYKSLNQWAYNILKPNEKSAYNGQCFQNPNHPACPKNLDRKYLVTRPRMSNGGLNDEFTICKTSLDCARTVLESLISIVSVRRYAHAFLPLDDIMKSPDLFNTYANPTACHLYDPWSKQRNAWKLFVADLGSALLQGASCGAIRFNVLNLPTDNVISFKEIYENEKMSYEAVTKHESLKYVAGIDYGFLPGLTCGASVGNIIASGRSYSIPGQFAELEVKTCAASSTTDYKIDRNVNVDPSSGKVIRTDQSISQKCFRCSFGLKEIAQNACIAPLVGQVASASVGLFQGIMRLISNLSDKNNIVKTDSLNIDQISESYKISQTMIPECHKKLKKGITCSAQVKKE